MADHSTRLKRHSAHNNVHPCSELCRQTVILDHRSFPNCPPQQRPTTQYKAVPTHPRRIMERTTPANLHEEKSLTPESLRLFLTADRMRGLGLRIGDLLYLWSTNIDPPITKASLSELELTRIINDAKLRHDLNFEREVSFRPNVCGDRGFRKRLEADAYWGALVIEFAIYVTRRQSELSDPSISGSSNASPWLQRPSAIHGVPFRLPRMFKAIKEILKTFAPGTELSVVDERLDVDLLLQQLERGACDIPNLMDWLGTLLLCCCSPQRDPLVTDMVSKISTGFVNDDPRLIVEGLRDLFGVLELMKLDVANHQIRYLRLLLIDDTIHFEQKIFLREVSSGLDLTSVRTWFQYDPASGLLPPQIPESPLSAFIKSTIEMIVIGYRSVPPTFRYDVDRIASLQMEFDHVTRQAACGQIFLNTLNRLGCNRLPSQHAYDTFLYRISAVAEFPQLNCDQPDAFRNIALEIVRSAYEVMENEHLPEETLVEAAISALLHSWDGQSEAFQELLTSLHRRLCMLVEQEMAVIKDKTPLQILDYYKPPPADPSFTNLYGAIPDTQNGSGSIHNIAKRIAHVATLHWRIWAPILYEQRRGENATMNNEEIPLAGEVDLAPAASMLMSEQELSDDIWKARSVKSDESSSDDLQPSPV